MHHFLRNYFIFSISIFIFNTTFAQVSKDASWLAPACKPKVFGLQNDKGEIVVPAKYDFIQETDGSAWIVATEGKYGVINSAGGWIIKPDFQTIIQYSNGRAVAGKLTKPKSRYTYDNEYGDSVVYYGVIDASGIWVIDPVYEFIRLCDDGSAQYSDATEKFGFLNPDGTVMLRPQYDFASRMTNGVAVIGELVANPHDYQYYSGTRPTPTSYFIIDRAGTKITTEPYGVIREFSDGRAAFNSGGMWKKRKYEETKRLVGGKWGFLDVNGKQVVAPDYDYVYDYENGKAKVRSGQRVFWIDKDGKETTPPIPATKPFTIYCEPGFFGYVDLKGNWAIEPQFFVAKEFSEGMAAVMALKPADTDCGISPENYSTGENFERSYKKYRIPLYYLLSLGSDYSYDSYSDRAKMIADSTQMADSVIASSARRLYGYIDITGNMLLPAKYEVALPFHDGRAYVCFRSKWGVIDRKGNWIIAPVLNAPDSRSDWPDRSSYEDVTIQYDYIIDVDDKTKTTYRFYEGMGCIFKYGYYGFIDTTGKVIAAPVYDEVLPFSNGLAAVRHADKWGFIDKTGKEIIPFKFQSAFSFTKEGLACVGAYPEKADGLQEDESMEYESNYTVYFGYIDKTGKWAIKPQFVAAASFSEGLGAVSIEYGKYGFIDKTGKFIIPPKYAFAGPFQFGAAEVRINRYEPAYIDKTGKVNKAFTSEHAPFDKSIPLRPAYDMNRRYGYINEKGTIVIPYQFKEAGEFKCANSKCAN